MTIDREAASTDHNPRLQLASGLLYIAQISGIVTLVAATIYTLGLFALLLPILNKYDVTFDHAWYMVSLVPKTVIAGHGVRSLVWPALFTVVPIAFVVVMILMLVAIFLVGARRAKHHASTAGRGELRRGVPFITGVYLAYSAVLGVVLLAIHVLAEYVRFSVPGALLQYHVVAGALAYAVFALLCLFTLLPLTWRAGRYLAKLVRTRGVSCQSLKEFGSRKVQMHLVLYTGMVCVVFSSAFLVSLFSEQGFSPTPVFAAWIAALLSLTVLGPVMLILVLLDRVFSSEFLNRLGTNLVTAGVALKGLLSMLGFCGALASILLFVAALVTGILRPGSSLDDGLTFFVIDALLLLLLLFVMALLSLVGKAIPLETLGGAGATLRLAFIAVVVVCMALLFWGFVPFVHDPERAEPSLPLVLGLLLFVITGLVGLLLLVVQGVRYVTRTATKATAVASPPKDSGRYPAGWVEPLRIKKRRLQRRLGGELFPVVRYAGVLFGAFYLTLLVTFLYGKYVIWPLIDNVNSISRSASRLDELFLVLTILGGVVSGALLYRGLFRPGEGAAEEGSTEEDLLSAGNNWRSFLKCFWRTTRPRPTWKWVAWSLTGAYVFSVVVGSLIAYLQEPPLPQVELTEGAKSVQPWVGASTEESGFQSTTNSLIAHTDGYWYLLDEDDGKLVAVSDQGGYMVQTPKYVELVDGTRALKVEVPSEWREDLSDYPLAWDKDPGSVETSRFTASTNVDNLGREYVTPGVFIEAYSSEKWAQQWGSGIGNDTVDEVGGVIVDSHSPTCGRPDSDPVPYDLEDDDHSYTAKIVRWRSCDDGGGYFAELVGVPEDRSFVLSVQVQLSEERGADHDAEADRILRSVQVRDDLLP